MGIPDVRRVVLQEAEPATSRDRHGETGDDVRDFANAVLRGVRRVSAVAVSRSWTKLDACRLLAEIDGVVRTHARRYGIDRSASQVVAAFALATVEFDGVPLDVAGSWNGHDWPEFVAMNRRGGWVAEAWDGHDERRFECMPVKPK